MTHGNTLTKHCPLFITKCGGSKITYMKFRIIHSTGIYHYFMSGEIVTISTKCNDGIHEYINEAGKHGFCCAWEVEAIEN